MDMFCPACGNMGNYIKKVEWRQKNKRLPPIASFKCPDCEQILHLEDRTSIDQEGTIEIIYH